MTSPQEMLQTFDQRLRSASALGFPQDVEIHDDGRVIRVSGTSHGTFIVTTGSLDLSPAETREIVSSQVRCLRKDGSNAEWKTYGHDLPAELPALLAEAGFEAGDQETLVIGRIAALSRIRSEAAAGVVIRRTVDPEDMRRIAVMKAEVWGREFPHLAGDLAARAASRPETTAVFVAEAGGRIVSAAWLELCPGTGFAGLWGGSTLPEWRGKGIYRTLVAARARLAAERGYEFLQVDCTEDSRPILERLGLLAVSTTTPYLWTPGAGNAGFQQKIPGHLLPGSRGFSTLR
ncbi:GNAT family N-acetyltransferase [Pseudarthrobacter sp. N5]|uniref:GNAT family N-acetyltransferase n=1 Tax=Pseudarthrobacter sp. N5 TaxID=3418416 RepID=UPI003CF6ABF2